MTLISLVNLNILSNPDKKTSLISHHNVVTHVTVAKRNPGAANIFFKIRELKLQV